MYNKAEVGNSIGISITWVLTIILAKILILALIALSLTKFYFENDHLFYD